MLCEECGKREATVTIMKKYNGYTTIRHLCSSCSVHDGDGYAPSGDDFFDTPMFDMPTFGGLFSGFYGSQIPRKREEAACPICGMTESQFRKSGYLGCSECYKTFAPTVLSAVKRMQGDVCHVGKIPPGVKDGVRIEYERLQKEIESAIDADEYEKAELIKDRMSQLRGR